jgi:hypothetical protein
MLVEQETLRYLPLAPKILSCLAPLFVMDLSVEGLRVPLYLFLLAEGVRSPLY